MARTINKRHAIIDGCIEPGTRAANRLNFNPVAFNGYIWKDGMDIWVPLISSNYSGRGNLSKFFRYLNEQGYRIIVPTPFDDMMAILLHLGFTEGWVQWEPSPKPVIKIGDSGTEYEWHKMGIKMVGFVVPPRDQVNVWTRS